MVKKKKAIETIPFWASPKIVFLNITSFTYIGSIGAVHFYGSLNCRNGKEPFPTTKVSIERKLTKVQAEDLCRKDGCRCYHAGSKTDRYESIGAVIRAARFQWKKNFPKAIYLIKTPGTLAIAEPQEVLEGPKKDELNDIFHEYGLLEWDTDNKRMEELEKQWSELLEI